MRFAVPWANLVLTASLVLAASLVLVTQSSRAQDESDQTTAEPERTEQAPGGKIVACRVEARRKGGSAEATFYAMQVCVAEARVDCVKQAQAQNVLRKDFHKHVKDCLSH